MSKPEHQLRETLLRIYEFRSHEIRVSPSWLATEAMLSLDSEKRSPPLVYQAAHLELRQLARSICRTKFEDGDASDDQHDLFPDLQKRYPAAHKSDSEPQYVLLEYLSEEDVLYNHRRMYAEAETKMRSADALLAWWQNRTKAA